MNSISSRLNFLRILLLVGVTALLLPNAVYAFGSKEKTPVEKTSTEKTPAEKKIEIERDAISKYNDGVKKMNKAKEIATKGDSTFAYNYRATSDAKAKKEYEKAIKNFKTAIELKPDMAEAHNNLGYCYRKVGKLKESLAAYEKAIALDKNFAQAREYRGETFLALGDLDQAIHELNYLKNLQSPYADTLQKSIDEFKLHQIQEQMNNGK